MDELINKYLEYHSLSWAPTTLKSERARLNSVKEFLLPQDPSKLWQVLVDRNIKPYARVTTWIRICHFFDWMIENGYESRNDYHHFRQLNKRLFKHAYQRRLVNIEYKQAERSILGISDHKVRVTAKRILETGMRVSEAFKVKDNFVTGKGNKSRKIYYDKEELSTEGLNYFKLYSVLRQHTGLTPHMLRKIFLTRVVEKGANVFELCEIAGWNSLQTAASYIKVDEKRLERLVRDVRK